MVTNQTAFDALVERIRTNQLQPDDLTASGMLNLSNKGLTDTDAMALAGAFTANPNSSIKGLDLSHNQIGDQGAIEIAKALPSLEDLTGLSIVGNSIGDQGREAIGEGIFTSSLFLNGLTLDGYQVAEGIYTSSPYLSDLPNLESQAPAENSNDQETVVSSRKVMNMVDRLYRDRLRKNELYNLREANRSMFDKKSENYNPGNIFYNLITRRAIYAKNSLEIGLKKNFPNTIYDRVYPLSKEQTDRKKLLENKFHDLAIPAKDGVRDPFSTTETSNSINSLYEDEDFVNNHGPRVIEDMVGIYVTERKNRAEAKMKKELQNHRKTKLNYGPFFSFFRNRLFPHPTERDLSSGFKISDEYKTAIRQKMVLADDFNSLKDYVKETLKMENSLGGIGLYMEEMKKLAVQIYTLGQIDLHSHNRLNSVLNSLGLENDHFKSEFAAVKVFIESKIEMKLQHFINFFCLEVEQENKKIIQVKNILRDEQEVKNLFELSDFNSLKNYVKDTLEMQDKIWNVGLDKEEAAQLAYKIYSLHLVDFYGLNSLNLVLYSLGIKNEHFKNEFEFIREGKIGVSDFINSFCLETERKHQEIMDELRTSKIYDNPNNSEEKYRTNEDGTLRKTTVLKAYAPPEYESQNSRLSFEYMGGDDESVGEYENNDIKFKHDFSSSGVWGLEDENTDIVEENNNNAVDEKGMNKRKSYDREVDKVVVDPAEVSSNSDEKSKKRIFMTNEEMKKVNENAKKYKLQNVGSANEVEAKGALNKEILAKFAAQGTDAKKKSGTLKKEKGPVVEVQQTNSNMKPKTRKN